MLPSANSLTSLSQQGATIIGPAAAAFIIAAGGTPIAFGLNALSFFISAACILPIFWSNPELNRAPLAALPGTGSSPIPAQRGLRSVFADIREGYKAVIASPWLWITIVIFAAVNATSRAPLSVSLPFLVKQNLHEEVGTLSLFTSMTSAGFVVGAVWLGRFTKIRHRGPIAYIVTLLSGVAVAFFGFTNSIPILATVVFLFGVCSSVFSLIWTNSLQELVPKYLLGRVSSIDALGSYVLLPVGYAISGWATDLIGAPLVFAIGGALTILFALLGLSHPAIRGLD
jgi:DHA3 family tetracycline resistance protein-like MFS transporter